MNAKQEKRNFREFEMTKAFGFLRSLTSEEWIYPVTEVTPPRLWGIASGAQRRNFALPQRNASPDSVHRRQRVRIFAVGFSVEEPPAVGNSPNGDVMQMQLIVEHGFYRVEVEYDSSASCTAARKKQRSGIGQAERQQIQHDLSHNSRAHEVEPGAGGRPRPGAAPRITRTIWHKNVVRVPPKWVFLGIRGQNTSDWKENEIFVGFCWDSITDRQNQLWGGLLTEEI